MFQISTADSFLVRQPIRGDNVAQPHIFSLPKHRPNPSLEAFTMCLKIIQQFSTRHATGIPQTVTGIQGLQPRTRSDVAVAICRFYHKD